MLRVSFSSLEQWPYLQPGHSLMQSVSQRKNQKQTVGLGIFSILESANLELNSSEKEKAEWKQLCFFKPWSLDFFTSTMHAAQCYSKIHFAPRNPSTDQGVPEQNRSTFLHPKAGRMHQFLHLASYTLGNQCSNHYWNFTVEVCVLSLDERLCLQYSVVWKSAWLSEHTCLCAMSTSLDCALVAVSWVNACVLCPQVLTVQSWQPVLLMWPGAKMWHRLYAARTSSWKKNSTR